MPYKVPSSNFGRLLRRYRKERGFKQKEVEALLHDLQFNMSPGLVSKYELGKIRPSPEFVYYVSVVLELVDDETSALRAAHFADTTITFMNEYSEVEKRATKKKRQEENLG
ncbi:MAG: helix-turn-helix domain-containing protein [Chloroflexota bacterium]|nr:helix-turn-helix domain-containing protein [Chloroflexota bacterium]